MSSAKRKHDATDLAVIRDKVKTTQMLRGFKRFVIEAWPKIDPAPLIWNWHLDAMCEHLQAVAEGRIKKLIINIPPGHAKSMIVSVLFPAWLWAREPWRRLLTTSYDRALAMRDADKSRTLIKHPWYQDRFSFDLRTQPDKETGERERWTLSDTQDAKSFYGNSALGFRIAFQVGTGTGQRGDGAIYDDLLRADDADSDTMLDAAYKWKTETMSSRFNDQANAWEIVVAQRLHSNDPPGRLLAEAPAEWVHLCLMSEFEDTTTAEWPCKCVSCKAGHTFAKPSPPEHLDALDRDVAVARQAWLDAAPMLPFWRDPRRESGDVLLFKAKFPQAVLDAAKKPGTGMGAIAFAGQHQQRPMPKGGGTIKRAWLGKRWHYPGASVLGEAANIIGLERRPYNPRDRRTPGRTRIIVTDCAFKEEEDNDRVAIGLLDCVGPDAYLIDMTWGNMGLPETITAIMDLRQKWMPYGMPTRICIEDRANGPAVISTMKKRVPGIFAVEPIGGKDVRIKAASDFMHSGNVWLPEDHPQVSELVDEGANFPKWPHDDGIDMLAYGVLLLLSTGDAGWLARLVKD